MNTTAWQYRVLGRIELHSPEGAPVRLERKVAACLTYLALEGPTHRARLVGLLWPDSPEGTARNNLSQMLRKLRLAAGTDLIGGSDVLALSSTVTVDALQVRDAATQGAVTAVLTHPGELLPGLTYDDCPDLDDWLTAERERHLEARAGALRAEIARLERAGEYTEALAHARTLLDQDPVSEDAHRQVMRLHYLRGDRPAALRAYHHCREVLRRTFDVDPLPETVQLARDIDRGQGPAVAAPKVASLPLSVLRPPTLVGREREWAAMERAWAAGQVIVLRGEPGAGKTRLAVDFAASRGAFVVHPGRPGDASQPFASTARHARTARARRPDAPLPDWVRREVSRIVPELAQTGEVALPMTDEADLLRYREASRAYYAALYDDLACVVADDWQCYDASSIQDSTYVFASSFPLGAPGDLPRVIITYRRGELSAGHEALLAQFTAQGHAVLLDVEPLPGADLALLMDDLGVPEDTAGRARLAAATGGNPLFVLETVKHLMEIGRFAGGLPEPLPLPGKVGQLIERRLSLLTPAALQAARAAAILQRDFDVELVAAVLHAPLFDAVRAWEELEAAQIVRGERFSHDLLYDTIRSGIPSSVRAMLHRNAARALEAAGAEPARVARHWLDGGRPAQAAPLLRVAADEVRARYGLAESAALLEGAAAAFAASDDPDAAFEALQARAETLGHLDDRAAREAALREAFHAASTPLQRARVWQLQADLHLAYHEGEASEAAAREGLALLAHDPLPGAALLEQRANLEACVGAALWVQGRMPEAAEALRRVVGTQEALGESLDLAANLSNLGVILDHLDQHREATVVHRRACLLMERQGDWANLNAALSNLAVSLLDQGAARAALEAALRAQALEERVGDRHAGAMLVHGNLGQIHHALGRYDLALHHYRQATRQAREGTWHAGFMQALTAQTLLVLGDFTGAAEHLALALAQTGMPGAYRARALLTGASLAQLRGEDPQPLLSAAQDAQGTQPRPLAHARLWLTRAQAAAPAEALALADRAVALAAASDLGGIELAAHARAAQALLNLGRLQDALVRARQAAAPLDTLVPDVITTGEALLTLARALAAVGDAGAAHAAARAQAWLQGVRDHLDAPHRASVLRHPTHHAIAQLRTGETAPQGSSRA